MSINPCITLESVLEKNLSLMCDYIIKLNIFKNF